MFLPASKLPARTLAGIAVASFAAVAFALVAQHGFGVKPCAWCVMQRAIFLLVGAVAALGWLLARAPGPRKLALALTLPLSLAGLATALYQFFVASKLESCAMTLADRINTALGLEDLVPQVFMVTANCAEASAYRLLGLPYEIWSALLFTAMALAGLRAIKSR